MNCNLTHLFVFLFSGDSQGPNERPTEEAPRALRRC